MQQRAYLLFEGKERSPSVPVIECHHICASRSGGIYLQYSGAHRPISGYWRIHTFGSNDIELLRLYTKGGELVQTEWRDTQ